MEFEDGNTRDNMLMRGPMLASYRDGKGRPTAGIRLHIPGHLMGVFKTLESFGHYLRNKHGNAFCKHIKFDEFDCSLFIQVGMKRENEKTDWTNYTAVEASDAMKKFNLKKKGNTFDFLASPPADNSAGGSRGNRNNADDGMDTSSSSPTTSGSSQRARGAGQLWIPPQRTDPGPSGTKLPEDTD